MEPVVFCWSGGKDSALCLYKVLQDQKYEVVSLLTTVNSDHQRISMHGISEELLDQQVKSIGIPLRKVYVNEGTNEEYERNMEEALTDFQSNGVSRILFGDIFLEDLREYRENNLAKIGMTASFPIWMADTRALVREFIQSGFKAITCCIADGILDKAHVGRPLDQDFIDSLPDNVDPCGENGEFHSFTYAGPIFKQSVAVKVGKKVYRPLEVKKVEDDVHQSTNEIKGFWYCDLLPG